MSRAPVEKVSLDQLFVDNEEVAPARPRRRTVPGVLTDLVTAAVIAGALYAVMRVFTLVLPVVILTAGIWAIMLLRRVIKSLDIPDRQADTLRSSAWGVVESDEPAVQIDGVLRAVRRWEQRFAWTERDHVRFASAVRPRLGELVAERLRQKHGVSVAEQPEKARAILGDPLWTFLTERVKRGPKPAELAALVAEMEKI
ncbi:hypothetical protein Val02_17100 [Virgisporangium aliadipatigenens]|uniref:Uncharacterized protein n=1 Tax=Virgisporangium aliadipatigenens TaxID=741659 RepID=A0A8J3YGL6_9ACTN|nr:hypothetical protein [Virgisporangium aliadipatigenens]GIJ44824.1 hypothetical protein Val02_17100 [Virgisporangium aliadipatigenens]